MDTLPPAPPEPKPAGFPFYVGSLDADALADWRYEVANGDTLQGFDDWRTNRAEASDLAA